MNAIRNGHNGLHGVHAVERVGLTDKGPETGGAWRLIRVNALVLIRKRCHARVCYQRAQP